MFMIIEEGEFGTAKCISCDKQADAKVVQISQHQGVWKITSDFFFGCSDCMPKETVSLINPAVQSMSVNEAIEWLVNDWRHDQEQGDALDNYIAELPMHRLARSNVGGSAPSSDPVPRFCENEVSERAEIFA